MFSMRIYPRPAGADMMHKFKIFNYYFYDFWIRVGD